MQRLHEDDLVGHVLRQEGWEVISFPAIAEVDERTSSRRRSARRRFVAEPAKRFTPSANRSKRLHHIRRTIGEYNFAGQYQQTPAPAGGGMVKEAWFRRYRTERPSGKVRPDHPELGHRQQAVGARRLFRLHDLGRQGSELLSPQRPAQEADFPDLKRAVREQSDLFNPRSF